MKFARFIFFIIFFANCKLFAQQDIKLKEIDTLPYFSNNFYPIDQPRFANTPRFVKAGNNITYVRIIPDDSSISKLEFFRMNDSVYYRIEYDHSGSILSTGYFTVFQNFICKTDSILQDNPNDPGSQLLTIIRYQKVMRSGKWEIYSNSSFMLSDYWYGYYKNDKRAGIWDHYVESYNSEIKIESFDFDHDSTKAFYTDNILYSLPLDSIKKNLLGIWWIVNGNDGPVRKEWDKSFLNGFWVYNLLKGNKLVANGSPGQAGALAVTKIQEDGDWTLIKKNDFYYLSVSFKDVTKNKKWKVLYLDRKGFMITESI